MIYFAMKDKHGKKCTPWITLDLINPGPKKFWCESYVCMIDDVIYSEHNEAFLNAFEQQLMWKRLTYDNI